MTSTAEQRSESPSADPVEFERDQNSTPAIVIIGTGGVGNLMATGLDYFKQPIYVVARTNTEEIRALGLFRTGQFDKRTISPNKIRVVRRISDLPRNLPVQLFIVATKANHVAEVARELAQRPDLFSDETLIVTLQNGVESEIPLLAVVPRQRIFPGVCFFGVRKTNATSCEVTVNQDGLTIGNKYATEHGRNAILGLIEMLIRNGVPTVWSDQIDTLIWGKVMFNIIVNAPAAIFQRNIGELMASTASATLVTTTAREAWCVAETIGVQLPYRTCDEYLDAFRTQIVPRTSLHRPSMVADFLAGRETEINFLNGFIARAAEKSGWVAGANRFLVELVKAGIRLEATALRYARVDIEIDKGANHEAKAIFGWHYQPTS